MERSKINSGTIRKAFLAIAVFNFANLILHFISCYFPVVFLQLDYGLYIVKISIYLALYLFLKKNFGNCFIVCQRFIMATIVLDAAELYMSNMISEIKVLPYILLLFVLIKFIIDCLMFVEYRCIAMQESFVDRNYEKVLVNRGNKSWIKFNVFILACFSVTFFSKWLILLYFTLFMIIVRFLYEIIIIRSAASSFRFCAGPKVFVEDKTLAWMIHRTGFYRKNSKCKPVMKKCLLGTVGIILLLGIYAYFSFDDNMDHARLSSEQGLNDQNGISCYYVYNRMPEWTGLRREKFGFINTETGMDTGARFKSIRFDKNGISWDGDDKYIDRNANTITKIPFVALVTTSHRQHIFRYFLANCPRFLDGYSYDYYGRGYDDHDDCIDYWNSMSDLRAEKFNYKDSYLYEYDPIFESGVTVFYSGFYDRYGLLRDDGTIAAKPVYTWINPNNTNSMAYVEDRRGNFGVINSDGKVLINNSDQKLASIIIIYDYDVGVFAFRRFDDEIHYDTNNRDELYHLMDKYGNEWEGQYAAMSIGHDVKAFHKYTGDHEYTTIAVSDGKILFESDQYENITGEKDDDGRITKLIGIKKSGEEETIYLE